MLNYPLRDVWDIADRHTGLLTCTSISLSGMWLVSSCQGGIVLFVDHKGGVLAGTLDLESQFYATALIWRSNTMIIMGCSNGIVYQVDFEYKSKQPVGMHTLIKSLKAPIRCMAFDTFRDMLAIACGGEVWIYVQSLDREAESWDCVDHILAPCAGPPGLVTALCFFGITLSRCHLFIGHAKGGWTIWLTPCSYYHTPYVEHRRVSTIISLINASGSAAISLSKKIIAIATLDQSLVTYTLQEGGPVVDTEAEVSAREMTTYWPVLPIVATSNNLILKGTAYSDIEILNLRSRTTTSMNHTHNHIISTLTAYGDKVVVGSTRLVDESPDSCLRCYTFSSAAELQDWRRINNQPGLIFEITLSNILPFTEQIALRNPLGVFGTARVARVKVLWRHKYGLMLVASVALLLALFLDPPSQGQSALITNVQPSRGPQLQLLPQKPALSMLLVWCAKIFFGRVSTWVYWLSQFIVWCAKLASSGGVSTLKISLVWSAALVQAILLIPRLIRQTLVRVPEVLAEFICNILRANGSFNEICP